MFILFGSAKKKREKKLHIFYVVVVVVNCYLTKKKIIYYSSKFISVNFGESCDFIWKISYGYMKVKGVILNCFKFFIIDSEIKSNYTIIFAEKLKQIEK